MDNVDKCIEIKNECINELLNIKKAFIHAATDCIEPNKIAAETVLKCIKMLSDLMNLYDIKPNENDNEIEVTF